MSGDPFAWLADMKACITVNALARHSRSYLQAHFLPLKLSTGPSVFPSGEPGVSGDFWGSHLEKNTTSWTQA